MKRFLLLCVVAAACDGGADPGGIPAGYRLITGKIDVPAGNNQSVALQVVGVYAAPDCSVAGGIQIGQAAAGVASCAIFGRPFSPAELGGGVQGEAFQLLLPCALTVNLVVQMETVPGGQAPGVLLAVLSWASGIGNATTTLLAQEPMCRDTPQLATNLIDLGEFAVPGEPPLAGPETVVLGGPTGGTNPLSIVDTDGDTIPNLSDTDDDGDGIDDAVDTDEDGDGIPDVAQQFSVSWFPQSQI
jgi:hypothetical protein